MGFRTGSRSYEFTVVLITGALTGIGRATALAFANEGARVVVSGRHDEEGKGLVVEVRKLGAEAEFIRANVRHEGDVKEANRQDRGAVWPIGRGGEQRRYRRQAGSRYATDR